MYYRLTYTSSTDKGKVGDSVINALKPLDIGQSPSCALQLPDDEGLEPTIIATIKPVEKGGWCIIRRTEGYGISVNGEDVKVAKKLDNKDEITFANGQSRTSLKYEVFSDGDYDTANGLVYNRHSSSHRILVASVILAITAVGIAFYALFGAKNRDLRHSIPASYADALYHITIDSVSLIHIVNINGKQKTEVIESAELQQAAVGTCFITDDGLLVTARHCLEPWLDDDTWDGKEISNKLPPDVRMAIEAETANMLSGNEEYAVRSHCIVSLGEYAKSFYSTDFHMDKSRDMVMQLGTDAKPLYWRTIFPIAHRRDMELGDFAYIKAPNDIKKRKGLPTATLDELKDFGKHDDHDIAVMGYPVNDNDADDNAKTDYGNAQPLELDSSGMFIGCMQMTAPINRGNSGGPVFAIIDGRVKVIGIVSKADRKADQQTFWAVPITEVKRMHTDGDKVKNEKESFIR